MQPGEYDGTLDMFGRIVPLPDHERARIERELRRRRRFIPVIVREFLTWEEMAKIEVNAPELPGILVDVGFTRLYPQGPALAHVVGYVAPPNEQDMGDDPMMALPGFRIGNPERLSFGGRPVYRIRWRTPDGHILIVFADAETGDVLDIRGR